MSEVDDLSFLHPIPIDIAVELGRCRLTVSELTQLGVDDLLELGRLVSDPLEIKAAGQVFARGEVVVVEERVGLRVTELVDEPSRGRG
jgi:flagellar motor switch protein FliN/FliY